MNKIRIGKDIRINWEITSTDESVILSKDNLTLEMTVPSKCVAILPFTFNDNVLSATFYGIDQKQLGNYWLTVWYKRGEIGQSALDKVAAFQLVKSTEEETQSDNSIAYAQVNLSGVIEVNGGGGGVYIDTYTREEIDDKVSLLNDNIDVVLTNLTTHENNIEVHVTAEDRARWNEIVGIEDIETQEGADYNTVTITMTNGDTSTFTIQNGRTTVVNVSDESTIIEGINNFKNF